jgi:CubicO group peptidase (beta-lactamase class C family)
VSLGLVAATCFACALYAISPAPPSPAGGTAHFERFERDVDALRQKLLIPGVAIAVFRDGGAVFESGLGYAVNDRVPVTNTTLFPIASLTKTMAAIRLFALIETGQLKLDGPAAAFLPSTKLAAQTTVRNLLSHTSDPPPGTRFLYSGARYDDLTAILETAGGSSFTQQLAAYVFAPAGMTSTYANLDDIPVAARTARLAKPYAIENGKIAASSYPSGPTQAATGVVSDLDDMVAYATAVFNQRLVDAQSLETMFAPFKLRSGASSPYGLGWFVTSYRGETVIWGYGQETAFSSLLVYVPARHVGAILLANSSALSDPFWLIFGNLRHSPFATAFLDDVAFPEGPVDARERELDEGMADAWLGERTAAAMHLKQALVPLPIAERRDPGVLATLARTKDPELLAIGEGIAKRMLAEDPGNVRTQFDYAVLLVREKHFDRALRLLRPLAVHPDSSLPWIAIDASSMIGELSAP